MERKIGEVFDFEGKKLKAVETHTGTCYGCFFKKNCVRSKVIPVAGQCYCSERTDKKQVVFIEAEQAANEEPWKQEELNLCEKLKYCPEGTQFWSPLINTVTFSRIDKGLVFAKSADGTEWDFNADSTITFRFNGSKTMTSQEPMLYPSREQRDWSKVKYERPVEDLPKTWEEFATEMGFNPEKSTFDGLYMELSDCMLAGGDDIGRYCDQHIAMIQLHALRDCYRQGWKPEYNETCWNIILFKDGEFQIHEFEQISSFLSFGNRKTARAFLNRFEDLIKEAGDLI